MATAIVQWVRERLFWNYGYFQGRWFAFPRSLTEASARLASTATSIFTLPLPFLSFLALPLFGGSSTTFSFAVFWLTWVSLILSHGHLSVELYGTLFVRLLCFLLPATAFFAFDYCLPSISRTVKARGDRHLPNRLHQNKLLAIAGIAVFNVLLGIVLQAVLSVLFTEVLHLRSLIKVHKTVPLPWTVVKDLIWGFLIRGIVHYGVHRYLLHTFESPLRIWHFQWQHSAGAIFSLVAAYDHPACYILAIWLPTMLPAYLFRWHVLTFQIFLAITSLEDLFIFSGFSVLPSSIIMFGMARRTEAHFDSVKRGKAVGNFGRLGLMDLIFGTACKSEVTLLDDVKDEAYKRQFQERVEDAVHAALAKTKDGASSREDDPYADGQSGEVDQTDNADDHARAPRRTRLGRKKAR